MLVEDWHDWDVAAAPILIRLSGGWLLLAVGGKDGYLYGIDPVSWRLHFQTPVTTRFNVDAPLTPEGTRFCPGVNGGVEWNGPSYSASTGLLYVGAIDWCTTVKVTHPDSLRGRDGLPWTGSAERFRPFGTPDRARRGWLTALEAEEGRVRWRYESPTPLVAGVTATAGGLVFTGDLEGNVLALDAERGGCCGAIQPACRWAAASSPTPRTAASGSRSLPVCMPPSPGSWRADPPAWWSTRCPEPRAPS